ncbi:MAG: HlyD family type I secretion periplasmic adaptor subunit [Pseudomonadota bacterium]
MSRDEFLFANNLKAALEDRPPRTAWVLVFAIAVLLLAGGAWAHFAVLDEVTTGPGKVVPSRQLQVVQPLEAGIVREILVREGQLVDQGQILMHIDDTAFSSELGELSRQRTALRAEAERLSAEARGAEAMPAELPADLVSQEGDRGETAYLMEQEVFRARRLKLLDDLSVLEQQRVQKEQEVLEFQARERKIDGSLAPLERELELTRRLHTRKVVPEVELLRLEREAVELRGEREIVLAALPRAEAARDEVIMKVGMTQAAYRAEARERLARVSAELSIIDERIRSATDRVTRTAMRAPVRGIVNALNVTTVGAVATSGQALAEIVPYDDTLLIEARIRPQDVAFIRPDQEASVKLSAYDYSVYGTLAGKVERIGADTTVDENGEAYYRIMVRTAENALTFNDEALPILPGMVATVDVLTGRKSVMDYLLKPIRKARHEALRER